MLVAFKVCVEPHVGDAGDYAPAIRCDVPPFEVDVDIVRGEGHRVLRFEYRASGRVGLVGVQRDLFFLCEGMVGFDFLALIDEALDSYAHAVAEAVYVHFFYPDSPF